MFLKQISVFIENRQGRLDELTSFLGENHIDLVALSIADTTNFGIFRAIVDCPDRAADVLRQHGYTAKTTDVLAVAVPDEPGGLARVLRMLREAGISIEYLYSLVRRVGHQAVIVFKVDEPAKAGALFAQQGIKLVVQDDISCEN